MGLDLYVGSLTRYYQRDWENVVQRMFPGKVTVVRPDGDPLAGMDRREIRRRVVDWSRRLAGRLGVPTIGIEDPAMPYFTDRPSWPGYSALLLWAACEDQGLDPGERSAAAKDGNWEADPALKHYAANPSARTRYPQLLLRAEMWLPIAAPALFRAPDAWGQVRVFGSVALLRRELDALADRSERSAWAKGPTDPPADPPLESWAFRGWTMMRALAGRAEEHGLPMVLDY